MSRVEVFIEKLSALIKEFIDSKPSKTELAVFILILEEFERKLSKKINEARVEGSIHTC